MKIELVSTIWQQLKDRAEEFVPKQAAIKRLCLMVRTEQKAEQRLERRALAFSHLCLVPRCFLPCALLPASRLSRWRTRLNGRGDLYMSEFFVLFLGNGFNYPRQ
jgi:hypothetical protein